MLEELRGELHGVKERLEALAEIGLRGRRMDSIQLCSASLRMLLRLWSSAKPESYNVKNLKRVLAAEVRIEIEKHIQQNLMVECDVMNDITLYLVGTKYIIAK